MFKFKKKQIVGAMVAVILSSAAASAYAEVNTWYDTFNAAGSLSSGWNNPNSLSMVNTDLVPAGYAIKNSATSPIWISSAETKTFIADNNYYMSYYLNTDNLGGVGKLFGIGVFDGTTPKMRVGVNTNTGTFQLDSGSLTTKKDLAANTSGKTYQVVARTWKGTTSTASIAYLYDVETGQFVADTINALDVSGINGIRSIKVGSSTTTGTQYISGFKMIEATGTDKTASINVVNYDMKEVNFSGIPSVITKDTAAITIPANVMATKGSNITYKSSDESVIDAEGNVEHGLEDKRIFIMAEVTNGTFSMERAYAVTVEGTGSASVASENWDSAGDMLSGSYVPAENGFTGAWKSDITLETDSNASVSTMGNQKTVYIAGINDSTTNANATLCNMLTSPINMDGELTYYAKFVVNFDSVKRDGNVRFSKVGFIKDGSSDEISSVLMIRNENDNMPEVGIKAGTITYANGKTVNLGSLYNVLIKIDAVSSGADTVSIKLWSVGLQEPLNWTHQTSAELTGSYSKIIAQTNAISGYGLYFGDLKLEVYTKEDVQTVAAAQTAVKDYIQNGTAIAEVQWPIENGIAKVSYENLKNLRESAYLSDIIFTDGTNRITKLSDASSGLSVIAKVMNDSGAANTFNKDIFLAKYNTEGKLEEVKVIKPGEIAAGGSFETPLTLENVSGKKVRLFVFDNEQKPHMKDLEISNSIKNY